MQDEFPEVFMTGKLPVGWTKETLTADALLAWGKCMAGYKPPEQFGKAMVLIGDKLGISMTPDDLSEYANTLIKDLNNN